jgi:glycosyltransferase involved in cell wall biosynthesis
MSDQAPLVSVVMNCLNGERFLREAIDSVVAQTHANWEIVFWDNGSTDGSAAIAQSADDRVRYFRAAETTTLGAARNLAVREARGDFIAFLDCDDLLLPDALERHLALMASGDYGVTYGGIVQIDERGQPIGRYAPKARRGDLLDALLRQFDIYVPAVMIRRAALEASGLGFDPSIAASEEYCLFMQLAPTLRFAAVPDPMAKYRVHDSGLTNRSIAKWADEREYTLDAIERANPGVASRHPAAFREARARARYYRARYFMSRGDRSAAIAELRTVRLVDVRYFVLYCMLQLPGPAWDVFHRARSGRSVFS